MSLHDRLRATADKLLERNGWEIQFQTYTTTIDSVGGRVKTWSNYTTAKCALEARVGGKKMEQFRIVPRAKYSLYVKWLNDDNFYSLAKAGCMRCVYQGNYFEVDSAVIHGDKVLIEMSLKVGGPIN